MYIYIYIYICVCVSVKTYSTELMLIISLPQIFFPGTHDYLQKSDVIADENFPMYVYMYIYIYLYKNVCVCVCK